MPCAEIHLVTGDDGVDEVIRRRFASLDSAVSLPDGSTANQALIVRKSSTQSEWQALAEGPSPTIIVLDGSVRHNAADVAPTDGSAAAAFLDQLGSRFQIPVLVVSQASLERLEFEILLRPNVAIWRTMAPVSLGDIDDTQAKFASIISNLKGGHQEQRIVISVGLRSAFYRVFDGHYWFYTDRDYKTSLQPKLLIRKMKRFALYEDNEIKPQWREELAEHGRDLYELLIEDVFGRHLLERVRQNTGGLGIRFQIDLPEGTIDSDLEDLFLLPFEATNADLSEESFFCARVPMARRVAGDDQEVIPNANDSLRILLVLGAKGGDASYNSEMSGASRSGRLASLRQATPVKKYLEEIRQTATVKRSITLEVLDAEIARDLDFQHALEDRLTTTEYDIVHFFGHSVGGPEGTFLFAPGSTEGSARPINIRAVAKWIGDKRGTKTKPPYLVFLSSCESGSPRTAVEMMKAGVINVIGFRWEIEEAVTVEFIRTFYKTYIVNGEPVTEAYRNACAQALALDVSNPGWVAATVFARDWGIPRVGSLA